MNTRHVSALAILLAAGCAHTHHQGARAESDSPALRAERAGDPAEPPVRGDRVRDEQHANADDRVEVPAHAHQGQLASTGKELPANKQDPNAPPGAATYGSAPDNTRVNERDRASTALTPMDQSESDSDRELVAQIRKAVIADDSLSFTAKNVKIITRDGQVTLRGAVNNAREKATIEKAARDAAGPKHVTNELEVSN